MLIKNNFQNLFWQAISTSAKLRIQIINIKGYIVGQGRKQSTLKMSRKKNQEKKKAKLKAKIAASNKK